MSLILCAYCLGFEPSCAQRCLHSPNVRLCLCCRATFTNPSLAYTTQCARHSHPPPSHSPAVLCSHSIKIHARAGAGPRARGEEP